MADRNGSTSNETRRTRLATTARRLKEMVIIMGQWLQVLGALLVLAAFAASQFRVLHPQSYPYLLLNVIGAAILAVLAYEEQQWGFLLLEVVWTLVSLWGVWRRARGRGPTPGY